ncbi:MAG TPA: WecB/TagA/CpsF family glycosyltransferase [Aggregatilineales bacterium]|nr:WecB/TagA/CpsF family glycosyltransferase [Aggregatilineales bacterium]
MDKQSKRPRILGVPADPITFEDMLQKIGEWVQADDGMHQICTINPEFIITAQHDPAFYTVLQHSDLNVMDGWGAVWALRLRGIDAPQRVTGSDGVPLIAERAAREGWRLYLLGGWQGVAEQAAQKLREKYPDIIITGTFAGNPTPDEAEAIIQRVNDAKPDILLVAYGAPRQDIWIHRYRDQLQVKVAMGIGGTVDFIAGTIPRAPVWMRKWGIEWLYRLYLQPSRWRRMMRLPVFAVMALLFRDRPPNHARSENAHHT